MFRPRIAVTVGDPRGIGPEVVAKALAADLPPASIVVIGPAPLIEGLPAAESVGVGEAGPVAARSASGTALTLDVSPEHAGRSVRASIEAAVRMALAGKVHARAPERGPPTGGVTLSGSIRTSGLRTECSRWGR